MKNEHDDKTPIAMSIDEVRALAKSVAREMKNAPGGALTMDVRRRFIDVRAALFQRGIYDPVLVRFDSATAPPASIAEVATELETVAESLAAG